MMEQNELIEKFSDNTITDDEKEELIEKSIELGYLDVLKTVLPNCPSFDTYNIPILASTEGHLHILKWCKENNFEFSIYCTNNASKNGHLDCLKFLIENRCDKSILNMFSNVCENGHLHCLTYLVEFGFKPTAAASNSAAENGHLECLTYLESKGVEISYQAALYAAENGHLECLKFIIESGYEWLEDETIQQYINATMNPVLIEDENGNQIEDQIDEELINARFECFKYCFSQYSDKSTFLKDIFIIEEFVDRIDMNDEVWKPLLNSCLNFYNITTKLENKIRNSLIN